MRLCRIRVVAYVHYPAISRDMINRVVQQRPVYNNNEMISGSHTLSRVKVIYYKVLMLGYSICGSFANLVMCNSHWTARHVREMWRTEVSVVYPPCDIEKFLDIDRRVNDYPTLLSIGQFRPEKDHKLQILSFSHFLQYNPEYNAAQLLLIGSARNDDDE